MVPPSSHRVSRVRRYSGFCSLTQNFIYRALTFFGRPSQTFQLSLVNAKCSPYPERIAPLGLASSAFARHYLRNLGWFLFLALLRCFSSGGSLHIPIWFSIWCLISTQADCSIRTSADQFVLANPRSFSQLTTSFVGSQCQGIRPALFLAWPSWIMLVSRLKNFVVFFTSQTYFRFRLRIWYFFPHCIYFCFIQFSRF